MGLKDKIGTPGIASAMVSVIITIAAWLLTKEYYSFVLGFIGLSISLQIDQLVKWTELGKSFVFFKLINEDPDGARLLHSLADNFAQTGDSRHPFFRKQAMEVLINANDRLARANAGSYQLTNTNDIQMEGLWLLKNLQKNLFATSLVVMDDLWFRGHGGDLHRENLEAAKRGRDITRIFIVEDLHNLSDARLQSLAVQQRENGIKVLYALSSELPAECVRDFGIWDDTLVCYLEAGADRRTIELAGYHTSQDELNRALRLKARILDRAKEFIPNTSIDKPLNADRRRDDRLLSSALHMHEKARHMCYKSYVSSEDSCAWYHGSWQYLRLLDLVGTPELHEDFFPVYLISLFRQLPEANILIAGLADYEMLHWVVDAIKRSGIKQYKILVTDLCPTPLEVSDWYAQDNLIEIETRRADMRNLGQDFKSDSFDVVVTDTFLTKLPAEDQGKVIQEWRRILKPGGRVLTTAKIVEAPCSPTRASKTKLGDTWRGQKARLGRKRRYLVWI